MSEKTPSEMFEEVLLPAIRKSLAHGEKYWKNQWKIDSMERVSQEPECSNLWAALETNSCHMMEEHILSELQGTLVLVPSDIVPEENPNRRHVLSKFARAVGYMAVLLAQSKLIIENDKESRGVTK